ncbi:hypothetical protein FKV24_010035 [Lysobacter maris]|uniref:Uncharacterized protein n=1 Tax=Marilutibacter maris TaxID=1605891 RepID=A0A508AQT0_9GAMM|nr:hypothetical protein [Lysobacter maris]KAB8188529.1 hypothetical protein FKV24_010035 [Lysobacter maris]
MTEPATPQPPLRSSSRLFEIVIGIGVLVISVVSVFVAVNANRTQERILAASVWPSLMFGTSNASTEGAPQITLDLLNRGTGPARVRWAELLYKDAPVRDSDTLLSLCCGVPTNAADDPTLLSSGIQRRVIAPGEWINLVRYPQPDPVTPAWEALDRERHNVRLRACYCSVLDECWLLDSNRDDPEPVNQCPRTPGVLWGS